ncbi:uncharacterized protein LOC111811213 [Cucurbita pepo subsp. pepo]|uniref:uncharacterized protein LOC111811213 n=1 Tax=Cucurbita pepo subsp. pepo TaxID=3664 RepID=UPI000C9D95F0|nr:uncharacterized protein LOC111811213 [Cucurbita pepo subsp. pepo]
MLSKISKPSRRVVEGLLALRLRLHFSHHPITSSNARPPFSPHIRDPIIRNSSSSASSSPSKFPSKPISSNLGLSQILYTPKLPAGNSSLATNFNAYRSASRFRLFSGKTPGFGGQINGNFVKKVLDKPAAAVSSAFSRYREAIGLQIEAIFRRNYLVLLGFGAVLVCALLWRIMFGIANTFIGFSEGMAKYGFLALSSAIVAFAGLYLRSRLTINPDRVYRMAMRKLNTSAGILEVMGAPLSGSDLRAYVMSGGGLTLKNFTPNRRSKRCFLIFPIRGSERKGLVSVEVKKKKGQYDMKLLAVDIPMASGPDQRLYLIGNEEEYKIGGGLISELRDPVVKAMAATKEFDDLDQIEEKEDAERERREAERKQQEETEKLEKSR